MVFDSTAIHSTQRFTTEFNLAYFLPIKSGADWNLGMTYQ